MHHIKNVIAKENHIKEGPEDCKHDVWNYSAFFKLIFHCYTDMPCICQFVLPS